MDRFIMLLLGIFSLSNAHDIDRCMDTAAFGQHCCKFDISKDKEAIFNECIESSGPQDSCDFDVCLGKKRGFVMSNGTLDRTALSDIIRDDFQNYSGLADILIEKCISDESDSHSQEDACYLKEIAQCLGFHAMANCPKWTETDECKKIKSQIADCKGAMP